MLQQPPPPEPGVVAGGGGGGQGGVVQVMGPPRLKNVSAQKGVPT